MAGKSPKAPVLEDIANKKNLATKDSADAYKPDYTLTRFGERGISLILSEKPTPELPFRLRQIADFVAQHYPLSDSVVSFASLLLVFKKPTTSEMTAEFEACRAMLEKVFSSQWKFQASDRKTHEIPVCYDPSLGLDILKMARDRKVEPEQIATEHSAKDYTIYALGFIPGFPFCGFVSDNLVAPRLSTPRQKVPAGSVGIAGEQTGIYPLESPGGWNILGRTPSRLYDPRRNPMVPFGVGDQIRLFPISLNEFNKSNGE